MQLKLKRLIDFCAATLGLFILSPLFLFVSIIIKLESPGPVLFCQERVGRFGKTFNIFKFRTMINNAANIGLGIATSSKDSRVTRIGRFLREYHVDELPQLLNVLVGDMSLVGPRPTIPKQLERYTLRQLGRHQIRPGITGLAQVNGNNELSWDERIELDLYYIDNYSLFLDIKILFKTVETVLRKKGVYSKDGFVYEKK